MHYFKMLFVGILMSEIVIGKSDLKIGSIPQKNLEWLRLWKNVLK